MTAGSLPFQMYPLLRLRQTPLTQQAGESQGKRADILGSQVLFFLQKFRNFQIPIFFFHFLISLGVMLLYFIIFIILLNFYIFFFIVRLNNCIQFDIIQMRLVYRIFFFSQNKIFEVEFLVWNLRVQGR